MGHLALRRLGVGIQLSCVMVSTLAPERKDRSVLIPFLVSLGQLVGSTLYGYAGHPRPSREHHPIRTHFRVGLTAVEQRCRKVVRCQSTPQLVHAVAEGAYHALQVDYSLVATDIHAA